MAIIGEEEYIAAYVAVIINHWIASKASKVVSPSDVRAENASNAPPIFRYRKISSRAILLRI